MTSTTDSPAGQQTRAGTWPRLPAWLWLWFPVAIVPVQFAIKALDEDTYRATMRGEFGLVENLTVVSLLVAIVCAFLLFKMRARVASRWFGPFTVMMGLGCFFFAGEEASWGQHWLGFAPPESVAERNDQGEFNLHNDPFFEKLLDQPPRAALTLAALVGGIIAPILRRRRGVHGPRFDTQKVGDWIWPTFHCLPTCVVLLTVGIPKKIIEALGNVTPVALEISPGETKELCLGMFLMMYLIILLRELRSSPGTPAS